MKQTFKKLRAVERRIRDCGNEMAVMQQLPYYRLFGRPGQLEADTKALSITLAQLETEKQQLLDELAAKIEKARNSTYVISTAGRNLSA